MEVILLVIDISAMLLVVRWSAMSETLSKSAAKNKSADHGRPPSRDDTRRRVE